jgi:hypothetical protein
MAQLLVGHAIGTLKKALGLAAIGVVLCVVALHPWSTHSHPSLAGVAASGTLPETSQSSWGVSGAVPVSVTLSDLPPAPAHPFTVEKGRRL